MGEVAIRRIVGRVHGRSEPLVLGQIDASMSDAAKTMRAGVAAPGADMSAAKSLQTFELVRGTSFAAPIVAGLLAARLQEPDPKAALRAVDDLAHRAVDLGAAGPDPVYGWGLVGGDLAPKSRLAAARAR